MGRGDGGQRQGDFFVRSRGGATDAKAARWMQRKLETVWDNKRSPITAFVIVIEMVNGHALVISLMATALIASQTSKFFAPSLYEALAERYAVARPQKMETPPAEVPRTTE